MFKECPWVYHMNQSTKCTLSGKTIDNGLPNSHHAMPPTIREYWEVWLQESLCSCLISKADPLLITKIGIPADSARTFAETFVEERITKDSLSMIDWEVLKELGVTTMGHALTILKLAKEQLSVGTLIGFCAGLCIVRLRGTAQDCDFTSSTDLKIPFCWICEVVHLSIQLCSKQSCPEKTTNCGEGKLFIKHLTVHIRAHRCMEIMVERAIISLHLLPLLTHCAWVVVFGEGWVLLNMAGCVGVIWTMPVGSTLM